MMLIETDVEPFWQDLGLAVEFNYLFIASKQVTSKNDASFNWNIHILRCLSLKARQMLVFQRAMAEWPTMK